jgi:hypothetical protein
MVAGSQTCVCVCMCTDVLLLPSGKWSVCSVLTKEMFLIVSRHVRRPVRCDV